MDLPDFLNDADGEIRLTGHRIGLHHLVYYYNEGYSAEMLLCEYPTLKLSHIHKTIAFYLDHRVEVDSYVAAYRSRTDAQRAAGRHAPGLAELRARLEARRRAEVGLVDRG
jgi:uncharacterized protein (DUF433 family)